MVSETRESAGSAPERSIFTSAGAASEFVSDAEALDGVNNTKNTSKKHDTLIYIFIISSPKCITERSDIKKICNVSVVNNIQTTI
jgi:hypothetical protein